MAKYSYTQTMKAKKINFKGYIAIILAALTLLLSGCSKAAEEDTLVVLPAPTPAPAVTHAPAFEPTVGYINANSLNMRKGPSTDSEVVKEYDGWQKIDIVGQEGDWYRVSIGGNVGYMIKEHIALGEPPANPPAKETSFKKKDGYVNAQSLNMREKPSTDADIVKEFSKGQKLKIVGETDDWYKVKIDGTTGYMTKEFVAVGDPPKSDETSRDNDGDKPKATPTPKPKKGKTPYANDYTPVEVKTYERATKDFSSKAYDGSTVTKSYLSKAKLTLVYIWSTT